jgi:hypothetical protein
VAARKAAEAESSHEGRDDDGDGENVRAAEERENALPDRLVDEGRGAAREENDEEDETPGQDARF